MSSQLKFSLAGQTFSLSRDFFKPYMGYMSGFYVKGGEGQIRAFEIIGEALLSF